MKKINTIVTVLFFAMLFCVQSSWCFEFNYKFVNRTGRWMRLLVIERGNPSMGIMCHGKRHMIDLGDGELKLLKTNCCVVQINSEKPSKWQILWRNHLIPKCKGVAVITTKGDGYTLQWKK